MLGLKLNHVSKRGHRCQFSQHITTTWYLWNVTGLTIVCRPHANGGRIRISKLWAKFGVTSLYALTLLFKPQEVSLCFGVFGSCQQNHHCALCWYIHHILMSPWNSFTIHMASYQHRTPHYKNKTVYFYNGNAYILKDPLDIRIGFRVPHANELFLWV